MARSGERKPRGGASEGELGRRPFETRPMGPLLRVRVMADAMAACCGPALWCARMSYDAPFAGLKVIDLSQGIAGPYCAMLLAQHGAEVIKVEGIGEGDWARTLGTRYGSHSAYSIIGNLGKKSIAVDLKTAAGKQVLWRLLEGADVFLEGFQAGRHPPPGLRLRQRRRARTAAALSLDLGLRPERAACRAAGDGPGAAGLYRPDDRESRRRRHPAPRAGDRGRHVDRALCLPGAVGRALRAPRRDARPLHRSQPDAGGDRAAVDPADGLPSRGRHHEAGRRAGRRVPDRRRLDVDRGHQRPRLAGAVRGDADAGAGRRSTLRHAGGAAGRERRALRRSCGRPSRPSRGRCGTGGSPRRA